VISVIVLRALSGSIFLLLLWIAFLLCAFCSNINLVFFLVFFTLKRLDLLEVPSSMSCKGIPLLFIVAGFRWCQLLRCHCVWLSLGTILWMFC